MALHRDEVFATLGCREGSQLEAGDIYVMFCGLFVLYITTYTTIPSVLCLYPSINSTLFCIVPLLYCTTLCSVHLSVLYLSLYCTPEHFNAVYSTFS